MAPLALDVGYKTCTVSWKIYWFRPVSFWKYTNDVLLPNLVQQCQRNGDKFLDHTLTVNEWVVYVLVSPGGHWPPTHKADTFWTYLYVNTYCTLQHMNKPAAIDAINKADTVTLLSLETSDYCDAVNHLLHL